MPYIIGFIVQAVIFGFATKIVIRNKGYFENWFWWGFFFGIIALLVASSKPENHEFDTDSNDSTKRSGWKCTCGKEHPTYVSSCSCGISKNDILVTKGKAKLEAVQKQNTIKDEVSKAAAIKEYKELMDSGIITPEEFEAKKSQLLGI